MEKKNGIYGGGKSLRTRENELIDLELRLAQEENLLNRTSNPMKVRRRIRDIKNIKERILIINTKEFECVDCLFYGEYKEFNNATTKHSHDDIIECPKCKCLDIKQH